MAVMQQYDLKAAGQTDPGIKRARNEDALKILIPPPQAAHSVLGALLLVADGMGGMKAGEIASRSAIEEITRQYYGDPDSTMPDMADPHARLADAIESANRYVREQAAKLELDRIGTTLAGLLVLPDSTAMVFNVGDSRVYRIRNRVIELLSTDQSAAAFAPDTAENGESSTVRSSTQITAFIGQAFPLEPVLQPITVHKRDIYILCTDGLWSLVSAAEIKDIAMKQRLDAIPHHLIALAKSRGAPDNVTVIVGSIGKQTRRRRWSLLAVSVLVLIVVAIAVTLALG